RTLWRRKILRTPQNFPPPLKRRHPQPRLPGLPRTPRRRRPIRRLHPYRPKTPPPSRRLRRRTRLRLVCSWFPAKLTPSSTEPLSIVLTTQTTTTSQSCQHISIQSQCGPSLITNVTLKKNPQIQGIQPKAGQHHHHQNISGPTTRSAMILHNASMLAFVSE